jgi:heme-degrading monooxygenase HmoA
MNSSGIAPPAGPGSLAVIFTSLRTRGDSRYSQTADDMVRLAAGRPGFLGMESVRGDEGLGITVTYWSDEDSITAWRNHADHVAAQRTGRERWYRAYRVRVCRIEREYGVEQ